MKSSHRFTILAVVAAAVGGHAVFAQGVPAQPSRAAVKSETRALEHAHKLAPAGEGVSPFEAPLPKSTKTRYERKAETMAARRQGELKPAGDAGDLKAERVAMLAPATKTRAERKSETRAAARAHQLIPAGEGPGAPAH
jgi:hypothetical protein